MKKLLQLLQTRKAYATYAIIFLTGSLGGVFCWYSQWYAAEIVRVKPPNLENYYSDKKGFLNIEGLIEGDLYMVDVEHKQYLYVMNIALQEGNLITTSPITTVRTSKDLSAITDADLELQGKIAHVSKEIKAEITEKVASRFTSVITNYYRKRLCYPLQQLNDKKVLATIKNQRKENTIFMLVTDVGYGDHLEIGVDRSMTGNRQGNIIKIGDFDVKVVFDQATFLVLDGKDLRLFYKLTPFHFSSSQGCFELYRKALAPKSYTKLWSQ